MIHVIRALNTVFSPPFHHNVSGVSLHCSLSPKCHRRCVPMETSFTEGPSITCMVTINWLVLCLPPSLQVIKYFHRDGDNTDVAAGCIFLYQLGGWRYYSYSCVAWDNRAKNKWHRLLVFSNFTSSLFIPLKMPQVHEEKTNSFHCRLCLGFTVCYKGKFMWQDFLCVFWTDSLCKKTLTPGSCLIFTVSFGVTQANTLVCL